MQSRCVNRPRHTHARTHKVDADRVFYTRVDECLRGQRGITGRDDDQLQVVLPRGAEVPQRVHRHELKAAAAVLEPACACVVEFGLGVGGLRRRKMKGAGTGIERKPTYVSWFLCPCPL